MLTTEPASLACACSLVSFLLSLLLSLFISCFSRPSIRSLFSLDFFLFRDFCLWFRRGPKTDLAISQLGPGSMVSSWCSRRVECLRVVSSLSSRDAFRFPRRTRTRLYCRGFSRSSPSVRRAMCLCIAGSMLLGSSPLACVCVAFISDALRALTTLFQIDR